MILQIIFVVLFILWIYQSTRKPNKFPPGPPRLPIIGSMPFMSGSGKEKSLLCGITEHMKTYGPVFGFYFGRTPAVVITDYHLIKEAFKNDLLSARPDFRPNNEVRPGWDLLPEECFGSTPGVIFAKGGHWKEVRRFTLRHLRDFGFGKSSMEDILVEEMNKMCDFLGKSCDQPISLSVSMNVSVVNALWSIICGEKMSLEDTNLNNIVQCLNNVILNSSPMPVLAVILPHPSMVKLPILRDITMRAQAVKTIGEVLDMIRIPVENHEKTLDINNPRDFLDVMLAETQTCSNPTSAFSGELGKATILNVMLDLFFAGMETTSSSLQHAVLQLLHFPDIQEKMYRDIERVVGKNRPPSLSDKDQMHYTNAVILESLRVSSLAYVGVPHSAQADVPIMNYIIPKGATVFSSLYHAMRDPTHFEDPDEFNPNRFIDSKGNYIHDERVIPFGLGKRACLGQSLAEKEFFLFFTGLVQRFEFLPIPGDILPSYRDIYPPALLRPCPKFKVILKKRV